MSCDQAFFDRTRLDEPRRTHNWSRHWEQQPNGQAESDCDGMLQFQLNGSLLEQHHSQQPFAPYGHMPPSSSPQHPQPDQHLHYDMNNAYYNNTQAYQDRPWMAQAQTIQPTYDHMQYTTTMQTGYTPLHDGFNTITSGEYANQYSMQPAIPRSNPQQSTRNSMSSVRDLDIPASRPGTSRGASSDTEEMIKWGYKSDDGSWRCSYPGCLSRSTFLRGCDLRKHYKRHSKTFYCQVEGCPQSKEGGFSSKKDRARHEAKHNPNVICEWEGCDRLFSRVDNMKDHIRRVHRHGMR